MKKNFLLAMIAMLMASVSSFAQKEYNMVITLSNGTTVTLGHNDIKEITFNDGKVAISGNMVNTIDSLAKVTSGMDEVIYGKVSNNIDSLAKVTSNLEENMVYDANRLEDVGNECRASIDVCRANIDKCMYSIAENTVAISDAKNAIEDCKKDYKYQINNCMDRIEDNKENAVVANAKIEDLERAIDALHAQISLLQKEIESK